MLTHAPMTTILPVKDLARARDFYQNKLGLEPQGMQADGKFLFRANGGAVLALFPKPEGTKAEHTAVSFLVGDIIAEIRALEGQGVEFHDYDLPGFKTVEHVCVLGSERAAWFNDTEGNILCLHEDIGAGR
jgi:catechol 2,3-dioxygenase-like lactoylglutathione lyase family enzyme